MSYLVWMLLACSTSADSWQIFIDADNDPTTGYGGGYEYVVRYVDEPPISLRDFQQVQLRWNETVDLDGWARGIPIRHTEGGGGPGGWGVLAGMALTDWLPGDSQVVVEVPATLGGRRVLEMYADGELVCP